MAISYPLSFPAVGLASSTFRLASAVGSSRSPFTAAQQVQIHQGEWWEGEVIFRKMTYAQSAAVKAFLAALRGRYGSFLFGDPDALARPQLGVGGTVIVNGGGQTGDSLTVDGMTPSVTVAKAGEYFQLGSGASARLHMLTEDLVSNGSGSGTMSFRPVLRSSPADNDTVTLAAPKGVFKLVDNVAEWSSDRNAVADISVSFMEYIPV